jgi:hypothetical protein
MTAFGPPQGSQNWSEYCGWLTDGGGGATCRGLAIPTIMGDRNAVCKEWFGELFSRMLMLMAMPRQPLSTTQPHSLVL